MATYNQLLNILNDRYQEDNPEEPNLRQREAENEDGLTDQFRRGNIPTQGDFHSLIYGMISRAEDGLYKSKSEPLSVLAAPDERSSVLHFHENTDQEPAWTMGLRLPTESATNGLNIAAGQRETDLFIEAGSGNVGIGTTTPQRKLDVDGRIRAKDVMIKLEEHFSVGVFKASDFSEITQIQTNGFGQTVSIFGQTLAIGAADEFPETEDTVFVYQYDVEKLKWQPLQVLNMFNFEAENENVERVAFGIKVIVQDNVIVVQAKEKDLDDPENREECVVYLYRYNKELSIWQASKKITGRDFTGYSQKFDPDCEIAFYRSTLVIVQKPNQSDNGFIFTFTYENTSDNWIPQQQILPEDFEAEYAISSFYFIPGSAFRIGSVYINQNWLVVGAHNTEGSSYPVLPNLVCIYKFDEASNRWNPSKLIRPQSFLDNSENVFFADFGSALYLRDNYLFIGAPTDSSGGSLGGTVYIFEYNKDTEDWLPPKKLTSNDFFDNIDTEFEQFGASISFNGDHLVVGAPGSGGNQHVGRIYFYKLDKTIQEWLPSKVIVQDRIDDETVVGSEFGQSQNQYEDTLIVGAKNDQTVDSSGKAYLYQKTVPFSTILNRLKKTSTP